MRGKSKTTWIGFVFAVLCAADPVIQSLETGDISVSSWLKLGSAVAFGAFGYWTGDKEKGK